MKKKSYYLITIILFLFASGFVVLKYAHENKQKKETYYSLKPRIKELQTAEWSQTVQTFGGLIQSARSNPNDVKSRISIASLYIREARITGEYFYYDRAALAFINEVLAIEPDHFEALTLKSLLTLSQHHFDDGLALAQKARNINPHNAFVYGILVDGFVEMGMYDSAVANADRMMELRPDIRSYARVSYLREIYGDIEGAIAAMQMAADAGLPGDESTEWSRIQLAHLYAKNGQADYAKMNYLIALDKRPDYAYALAGLGDLALSQKNREEAIDYYRKANALIHDFGIRQALIHALKAGGHQQEAADLMSSLLAEMAASSKQAESDEEAGHYADQELAIAYLQAGNHKQAQYHALAEYNRRPKNIDVNETVAWVYHQSGESQKAVPFIEAALRTNCSNPTLLCRAGLIYDATGNQQEAMRLLQKGLEKKPIISVELLQQAKAKLNELNPETTNEQQ